MLLTKAVKMKWNPSNKKWYEEKGFTKWKDDFEVKIEDLSKWNKIKIVPICDKCETSVLEGIPYAIYYNIIKNNNGKYFCKKCSAKIKGKKQRKSPQQFKKEFDKLANGEYSLLEDYIDAKTKVLVRHNCEKCNNYEWKISPDKFLNGRRCPKCANNIKKTLEQFKKEIYNKFGNDYTVLGKKYINTDTPIRIRHNCSKCNNYEWDAIPKILLKSESKCPKCSKKAHKTTEQFKQEAFNLVGDEYIVLGEYKNAKSTILMKHNCIKCNNKFFIEPTNFLSGKRCPTCNESKGEKRIEKWLIDNNYIKNIDYIPQKEFKGLLGLGGNNLSYDFYLPNYNLLIEYQGEYHDGTARNQSRKDFEKQRDHDERKRTYAIKHNIKELEIWYNCFDDVEYILNIILDNKINNIEDSKGAS